MLVDGGGIPLAAEATAANVTDVTRLEPLVEAIPALSGGRRGRPRRRPRELYADRAYQCRRRAARLRRRGIRPRIAKRGDAPRRRPRQEALGGGAHDLLAAQLRAPARAPRPPRRNPRCMAQPRMRNDMPGKVEGIMLGPLREKRNCSDFLVTHHRVGGESNFSLGNVRSSSYTVPPGITGMSIGFMRAPGRSTSASSGVHPLPGADAGQ